MGVRGENCLESSLMQEEDFTYRSIGACPVSRHYYSRINLSGDSNSPLKSLHLFRGFKLQRPGGFVLTPSQSVSHLSASFFASSFSSKHFNALGLQPEKPDLSLFLRHLIQETQLKFATSHFNLALRIIHPLFFFCLFLIFNFSK